MKLLMTTDTVGGVWVYSLELCKALQKYDVQVHLAALGDWPSRKQEQEVGSLKNVILYKSGFKLEWMQDPWEDVEKSKKWVNCIYHTIQPDFVHLNNYMHLMKDWNCPHITVFHSCVQTWWHAVKGTLAPAMWDDYVKLVKTSLNNSDVVVSPTHAMLQDAIFTHDIRANTEVIYNGREMHFPKSNNKEPMILCAGRIWDEAKNLKVLSEVAKNLPWPVYIAGSNKHPVSKEEIQIENVKFLGQLSAEEVQLWMQRASIFLSPTKYEPFGLAILEAAKAGCVLVLSELRTLKEIWGTSACYFEPTNPRWMEQKLLDLIQDPDLRNKFSEKAKQQAQLYSSEKMGTAYYNLYQKIRNRTKSQKIAI